MKSELKLLAVAAPPGFYQPPAWLTAQQLILWLLPVIVLGLAAGLWIHLRWPEKAKRQRRRR